MFTRRPIACPRARLRRESQLTTAAALLAITGLAAAGCGGGAGDGAAQSASATPVSQTQLHAFAWLRPSPPPPTWRTASLPGGAARMAYPAGWRAIRSDPGTVSAALRSGTGEIIGYLNATPRQGAESLGNWSSFRVDHNGDEGDVDVTPVATARNLRFRAGSGSCVVDDYTSSSGHDYREIACIVAGASATTVVVGAAPPAQWPSQGPAIEQAISSFLT
jgi:hypothetical protein